VTAQPEPRWLLEDAILSIHDMLIREHGGTPGIRDHGLLASALARPKHLFTYAPDSSLQQLAAAYGYGLAHNHAFVDGNKRIALVAMAVFLEIKGLQLIATEVDAVIELTGVAAGEISEEDLVLWLERNTAPTLAGRGSDSR